jgi:hypothetical protein
MKDKTGMLNSMSMQSGHFVARSWNSLYFSKNSSLEAMSSKTNSLHGNPCVRAPPNMEQVPTVWDIKNVTQVMIKKPTKLSDELTCQSRSRSKQNLRQQSPMVTMPAMKQCLAICGISRSGKDFSFARYRSRTFSPKRPDM